MERRRIFTDFLHLLTTHEPGNDFHIVPEVSVVGGSVDYFLVSAKDGKARDFVGVEIQTLDTTGTAWPERQRLVMKLGVDMSDDAASSKKTFGMNWKMTSKTALVQMHHKISFFEAFGKKLVLVMQDGLLEYMTREFDIEHLKESASLGDSMHFHIYSVRERPGAPLTVSLDRRLSTDAEGVGRCLGLQAEAKVDLRRVMSALERKMSSATLFFPA